METSNLLLKEYVAQTERPKNLFLGTLYAANAGMAGLAFSLSAPEPIDAYMEPGMQLLVGLARYTALALTGLCAAGSAHHFNEASKGRLPK